MRRNLHQHPEIGCQEFRTASTAHTVRGTVLTRFESGGATAWGEASGTTLRNRSSGSQNNVINP